MHVPHAPPLPDLLRPLSALTARIQGLGASIGALLDALLSPRPWDPLDDPPPPTPHPVSSEPSSEPGGERERDPYPFPDGLCVVETRAHGTVVGFPSAPCGGWVEVLVDPGPRDNLDDHSARVLWNKDDIVRVRELTPREVRNRAEDREEAARRCDHSFLDAGEAQS